MAATDNIDFIIGTLRSAEFEGFRSELYIPMGCFIAKGSTQVPAQELKSEYNQSLKPGKGRNGEIPGLETLCKTSQARTWKPVGNSGFTIAAGFDISKHNINDLRKFRFNSHLEDKLIPFSAGYAGPPPSKKPSFSHSELKEIDYKVIGTKLPKLSDKFNGSSTVNFDKLNIMYQTVLYSIFHQYQNHFFSESYEVNKVWKFALAGDWKNVRDTLKSIRTYSMRRKKEAELIDQGITYEGRTVSPVGDFKITGKPVV